MANQGGGNSVFREYRKGNWTVEETMVLIEAKKMDDERRMKRSIGGESSEGIIKMSSSSSSHQTCRAKMEMVRDYERRRSSSGAGDDNGGGSYWKMEKHERKERNLPSNMLPDIYQALMEVVERKESVSPRVLALPGLAGGGGGYVVVERSAPLAVLPLPPPPPPALLPPLPPPPAAAAPLQALPHHDQPLPTVDSGDTSEHSDSPAAKKRRRGSGEGTSCGIHPSGTPPPPPSHDQIIGCAISRSASIIVEAIQACDEREDRRHGDLLSLQERRLHIEESNTEITRQGFNGLVDAINKLANSILALANSNHHQTTTTPKMIDSLARYLYIYIYIYNLMEKYEDKTVAVTISERTPFPSRRLQLRTTLHMAFFYYHSDIFGIFFHTWLFKDHAEIFLHGSLFSNYKKAAPLSFKGRPSCCQGPISRSRAILTIGYSTSSPVGNRAHTMESNNQAPDPKGLYREMHGIAEQIRIMNKNNATMNPKVIKVLVEPEINNIDCSVYNLSEK
ncbi:hydroxyproline-rich glycoprotein family protein [Actinidia rufa]|uniref:Hydroxyproline-rich glycoprotein family protein n=1 Tax=Actinidia rufa TaxID=165716 RepID=A0A7J0F9T9_9ERIC|nr:hydroxyproline-rich glycoprotein family protein [Actinidia rufa]